MKLRQLLETVSFQYDRNQFTKIPWNWNKLIKDKIVNCLFYYSIDNYVNGKPEKLKNFEFSLITLENLRHIPSNELSKQNKTSGYTPTLPQFLQMLTSPDTWYDEKIDQFYKSIKLRNKAPEYYNGIDIRTPH